VELEDDPLMWCCVRHGALPFASHAYGCCHGRPTSLPWGTVYHHPESKVLRLKPEYAVWSPSGSAEVGGMGRMKWTEEGNTLSSVAGNG
jgi:hypothetical protein